MPAATIAAVAVEGGLADPVFDAQAIFRLLMGAMAETVFNQHMQDKPGTYNPDTQLEFLKRFGLGDWQKMVLTLTVTLVGFMSLVGFAVLWQMRKAQPTDRALLLWRRATRRLASAGLPQRPDEGPRDYAARVMHQRPDLAPVLQRLLDAYLAARYLDLQPIQARNELALALSALKT